MDWISRRNLLLMMGSALGAIPITPNVKAKDPKSDRYNLSDVDMSVSLAPAKVRTPVFPVVSDGYFIMIGAQKQLPFLAMRCLMAAGTDADMRRCEMASVLEANWIVWNDKDQLVARGTSPSHSGFMYTNKEIFKILGIFVGEVGGRYLVEIEFTKDGSILNKCKPHLIVIREKYH